MKKMLLGILALLMVSVSVYADSDNGDILRALQLIAHEDQIVSQINVFTVSRKVVSKAENKVTLEYTLTYSDNENNVLDSKTYLVVVEENKVKSITLVE